MDNIIDEILREKERWLFIEFIGKDWRYCSIITGLG
jgi:hypothetical protein